jgi:hypothetical protein
MKKRNTEQASETETNTKLFQTEPSSNKNIHRACFNSIKDPHIECACFKQLKSLIFFFFSNHFFCFFFGCLSKPCQFGAEFEQKLRDRPLRK